MARPRVKSDSSPNNGSAANIGFESTLWATADKLRNNMDASEYKHVVLGLIFLKYISDAFEEKHAALLADKKAGADPEDPDEYRAENIFWVPKVARWSHLRSSAKQPTIGKHVDDAMVAIERDNPTLKGVLPKDFARPSLDKQRLGELIDLISSIGLGDKENRAKDILGRVYEYFLSQFASAEGKKGGQFYTPQCVVRVLVEMLAPYKGRVFDPCCGSGGMFVQSEKFVEAHDGRIGDISVYGQESNTTTWRLAKMNLAIRGIDTNLGEPDSVGSFLRDQHKDLKADYVIANPPFNDSDWGGDRLREDARWKFGVPPAGNANFAWVQHFIHHLAPNGIAGFVLANGSMSSNQSGEGEIRKQIVEADMVDCMVALPGQLFYSTQIPVCLWFVTRSKVGTRGNVVGARGNAVGARCNVPLRDRRGETLFIDARKMGRLIDRVHRELTDEEISLIAGTYHAWRGDAGSTTSRPTDSTTARPMDSTTLRSPFVGAPLVGAPSRSTSSGDRHGAGTRPAPTLAAPCGSPKTGVPYADIPGFCKSADIDEIRKHGHVLTPGRYVGAAEVEDDGEPIEQKLARLKGELFSQFEESERLAAVVREQLGRVDV
jgi:type I restriction enzyme M protein